MANLTVIPIQGFMFSLRRATTFLQSTAVKVTRLRQELPFHQRQSPGRLDMYNYQLQLVPQSSRIETPVSLRVEIFPGAISDDRL